MTNEFWQVKDFLGVHPIAPVTQEPVTIMTIWSVVKSHWADGRCSRHLVGQANCEGRVCSAIQRFDLQGMEAQTQSGRLYRLLGDPGRDRDALYVFDVRLLNQQPRRI